jgi:hypothetical protein
MAQRLKQQRMLERIVQVVEADGEIGKLPRSFQGGGGSR